MAITRDYILTQMSRNNMAAEVRIPSDVWGKMLDDMLALVNAGEECAIDLERMVKAEYTGRDGKMFDLRRYQRDLAPVVKLRAIIAEPKP